MTNPVERDFTEDGRLLFAGPCEFIFANAKPDDLPPLGPPEIAFAGRSNVGKSSLLNALANRKTLARVSNTPGRTQQLNFFALGGASPELARLRLIDMPGYGYAAVGKAKVSAWSSLIRDYLRGRATLARVFVLIDGRRGVKDLDEEMFDLLDRSAVSYQIVLTKHDELKVSERAQVVEFDAGGAGQAPGRLSAHRLHVVAHGRRHSGAARRHSPAALRTKRLKFRRAPV